MSFSNFSFSDLAKEPGKGGKILKLEFKEYINKWHNEIKIILKKF